MMAPQPNRDEFSDLFGIGGGPGPAPAAMRPRPQPSMVPARAAAPPTNNNTIDELFGDTGSQPARGMNAGYSGPTASYGVPKASATIDDLFDGPSGGGQPTAPAAGGWGAPAGRAPNVGGGNSKMNK